MLLNYIKWSFAAMSLAASVSAFGQQNPDINFVNPNTVQLPIKLSLGFGQSIPEGLSELLKSDQGPDRQVGGEVITVSFAQPHNIGEVRITAYSKSSKGKVLIHKVEATEATQDSANPEVKYAVPELFSVAANPQGQFNVYKDRVMLENSNFVYKDLGKTLKSLSFQVEGYTDNDATLLLEITSPDGFNYYDFQVKRTSPDWQDDGDSGAMPTIHLEDGDYHDNDGTLVTIRMREQRIYYRINNSESEYTFKCSGNRCRIVFPTEGNVCKSAYIDLLSPTECVTYNPCVSKQWFMKKD